MQVMDDNVKRDYVLALETVPDLVKAESPAINFLRREDFNTTKACRRLALYWQYRRRIFGDARWLLPMTQTSTGALSSTVIDVVRSGAFLVISSPKPILVVDLSRLNRPLGEDGPRWMFYFGTIASDELTQTEGCTIIHRVTEGQRLEFVPAIFEMVRDALPLTFKQKIVVSTVEEGKKLLADFLTLQTSRMVEYNMRSRPNYVVTASADERLQLLEDMGIPRQSLPVSLGGFLGEDYHSNWIRARISKEDMLGSIIRNSSVLTNTGSAMKAPKRKLAINAQPNGNDNARQRNAVHHQRWLQKQELKKNSLQERSKLEKMYNAQLLAANQKLTSLLAQAKYIVALHTTKSDKSM